VSGALLAGSRVKDVQQEETQVGGEAEEANRKGQFVSHDETLVHPTSRYRQDQ